MGKATIETLAVIVLVLGLTGAAMIFITDRITDSLNASAAMIENPGEATR